jgi:uncharacterized membrane protein YfcA
LLPELSLIQWVFGILCAFLTGVAKTGVPGLGILIVPMMVLSVGEAKQAAGWLLPMLCTADLFAVFYWRRHAAASRLFSLIPWVLGGMAVGAAALGFSERVLKPMTGTIVALMLCAYLWRRYRAASDVPPHAGIYGVSAGFATTVANAAGPVMNLYLLSQRLPKEEFVATGAWFFFTVNLTKVPIYAFHGMLSKVSLTFDLMMVPMVVLGALTGRWIVMRINAQVFEFLVIAMTAVSTVLLFR